MNKIKNNTLLLHLTSEESETTILGIISDSKLQMFYLAGFVCVYVCDGKRT